jgi:antitoxin HicB
MMNYPVTITPDDNGTLLIGFPDFPEANSVGENEADALTEAVDALESAVDMYFDQRRPVPEPSVPQPGQHTVSLPALVSAKVLVWNEMFAQKLRKADLARMLGVQAPQVDRLFNLKHASKIEFVEQAANALGKKLSVTLAA